MLVLTYVEYDPYGVGNGDCAMTVEGEVRYLEGAPEGHDWMLIRTGRVGTVKVGEDDEYHFVVAPTDA